MLARAREAAAAAKLKEEEQGTAQKQQQQRQQGGAGGSRRVKEEEVDVPESLGVFLKQRLAALVDRVCDAGAVLLEGMPSVAWCAPAGGGSGGGGAGLVGQGEWEGSRREGGYDVHVSQGRTAVVQLLDVGREVVELVGGMAAGEVARAVGQAAAAEAEAAGSTEDGGGGSGEGDKERLAAAARRLADLAGRCSGVLSAGRIVTAPLMAAVLRCVGPGHGNPRACACDVVDR